MKLRLELKVAQEKEASIFPFENFVSTISDVGLGNF